MAKIERDLVAPASEAKVPGWVISHMIAVCEYAENAGLSLSEAKLVAAVETMIKEVQDKDLASCPAPKAVGATRSNVTPFPTLQG